MIYFCIFFVVGIIFGAIVGIKIWSSQRTASGSLIINTKNPDQEVYRLELNDLTDLTNAKNKKWLVLKVMHE